MKESLTGWGICLLCKFIVCIWPLSSWDEISVLYCDVVVYLAMLLIKLPPAVVTYKRPAAVSGYTQSASSLAFLLCYNFHLEGERSTEMWRKATTHTSEPFWHALFCLFVSVLWVTYWKKLCPKMQYGWNPIWWTQVVLVEMLFSKDLFICEQSFVSIWLTMWDILSFKLDISL